MIYVHLPLENDDADYLRKRLGPETFNLGAESASEGEHRLALQADIILGNPPVEWLREATRLRWLQLKSAGFSEYTELQEADLPFTITNCTGLFGVPVAETALAGILSLLREIPTFVQDKYMQRWRGADIRPQLGKLTGSWVIILGSGSIGGTFRKLLSGFDCRIETMGRRGDADFYTRDELDARLPTADIVVAALPETEATVGLFDAQRLALLSPTCIFANVGRGSLVDETALLAQLQAGRLGGAVLDVTRQEPLPADDPLWRAPRTLLTQHSAGGAWDENRRIIDRFVDNLVRYRSGQPLKHVIELERGY
ncbi:D-2-hydroxyacid dehydrogenase [Neolewinella litorea]|nr:D-2-hydroxyacid dehydrogenase [Neolewinella litorea]